MSQARWVMGWAAAFALGGCTPDIDDSIPEKYRSSSTAEDEGSGGDDGMASEPSGGPPSPPTSEPDQSGYSPGGCTADCCPTDSLCYTESGRGAECLAAKDLSMEALGQSALPRAERKARLTWRHMWNRSVLPEQAAIAIIYQTLLPRAELPLPQCNMPDPTTQNDTGGGVLLIEANGLADDISGRFSRSGYAAFPESGESAIENGLQFARFLYEDPKRALSESEIGHLGMPLPWQVEPTVTPRVAEDFEVQEIREQALADGFGRNYVNQETGYSHTYSVLNWVVLHDNPTDPIVLPIHEVETILQPNSPDDPTCVGWYNAHLLEVSKSCRSDDAEIAPFGCPPDDVGAAQTDCEIAPMQNKGYFKVVEMEQVWSPVLSRTLCCQYLGAAGEEEGWCDPTTWGLNCSGSPKWDPSDPVNGIPRGDWCSETNAPATDECHDAWRSISNHVLAGFPIPEGDDAIKELGTIVNSDAR